ncbi:hypothetical protein SDC9_173506 [bioreactor metagenome]|uniref:Uncharacterized protein n=1 Tax=bioreactor metagenome TaxID=1076179 RepID=A0A645GQ44_9ZZZZ
MYHHRTIGQQRSNAAYMVAMHMRKEHDNPRRCFESREVPDLAEYGFAAVQEKEHPVLAEPRTCIVHFGIECRSRPDKMQHFICTHLFDSRGYKAFNELFLEYEKYENQRCRNNERCRTHIRPLQYSFLALCKECQADGEGSVLHRIGYNQGPEEVIPVVAYRN